MDNNHRRRPGRPRKDKSKPPTMLSFQGEESVARFLLAKEEYERTLPYILSHAQFLDALLNCFKESSEDYRDEG